MQAHEKVLKAPNGELFVKVWSPAVHSVREPLILFHDSLGSVAQWRDFPEKLARMLSRKVVAYDRLGFGKSSQRQDTPSSHFIAEEAEVFFPIIKRGCGVSGFGLFGHSVGGLIALTTAARYPHECKFVISESAQAFVEKRTLDGIRAALVQLQDERRLSKLRKFHGPKTDWVIKVWAEIWQSEAFANWSIRPELGKVTCPALVIHGDQDEYGSTDFPKTIAQGLAGPVELQILEGLGHFPYLEDEARILRLVSDFIGKFG